MTTASRRTLFLIVDNTRDEEAFQRAVPAMKYEGDGVRKPMPEEFDHVVASASAQFGNKARMHRAQRRVAKMELVQSLKMGLEALDD